MNRELMNRELMNRELMKHDLTIERNPTVKPVRVECGPTIAEVRKRNMQTIFR